MLQDSLNLLRSQYLGLNRILSTLSELVQNTVQSQDEAATIHQAIELLLHNHNFEYVAIYLQTEERLELAESASIQKILTGEMKQDRWLQLCEDVIQRHVRSQEAGLIQHQIDESYYYSIPFQFDQQLIGFVVVVAPSFDDNHEKFLPMFANVLMSLLLNKRQQAQLTEQVARRSEELESAWDAAQTSHSAKTRFLSRVSHEYLTPLNSINNAGSVLLESDLSSDQAQAVNTIVDSVTELRDKIDHSLNYVQSEAAQLVSTQKGVDLSRLATHLMAEVKASYKNEQVEIRLDLDDLPLVDVDSDRLRQVLTHLISNAVKFTDQGVIELNLSLLTIKGRIAQIEFRVSDTGLGIAPSDQVEIFRAFPKSGNQSQRRGAGLGLALCQRLTQSLGGEIVVASALGKGSTFHFCLELTLADQVFESDPAEEISDKLSVLLVEDNLVNQKLAAKLLENMGCEVDVANDGVDAVDKFSQATYDVVFMDCQMPNMDGFEATSKMRELESGGRTPIIALTANSLPEDRKRSFSAGMDEFLTKPIAKEQLMQALHRWSN